jgi:predicted membrane protein
VEEMQVGLFWCNYNYFFQAYVAIVCVLSMFVLILLFIEEKLVLVFCALTVYFCGLRNPKLKKSKDQEKSQKKRFF